MKKIFSLVLCVLIVCVSLDGLAATGFHYEGTDTVDFRTWTINSGESNGTQWHIGWASSACNITSTHRAVVRVHAGAYAASATWVYSSLSTKYHPYLAAYANGQAEVDLWGRMDDRDSGVLMVMGTFYN